MRTYINRSGLVLSKEYLYIMESRRQRQVGELIKRHFSTVLQQEGGYIYGMEVLVSVTHVIMSPDLGLAKIYVSVYNTENKQAVLLQMEESIKRLKQQLVGRIRKQVRRIPHIAIYLDETLDEIDAVENIFARIKKEQKEKKD